MESTTSSGGEPTRSVQTQQADAVVVAYGSSDVIGECLASLRADPAVARIIIVNNTPGDATQGVVDGIPNHVYLEPGGNVGFGSAVNMAREYVRTDYVVLANPDAFQDATTTTDSLAFLADRSRAALLAPRMVHPDGRLYRNSGHDLSLVRMVVTKVGWPQYLGVQRTEREHGLAHSTDYVIASFVVCRTKALDSVGWFDGTIFLFGEDQDLCRRLRARNWEIWYAPIGRVVHLSGHSWRQLSDEGVRSFREARYRELCKSSRFEAGLYTVLLRLSNPFRGRRAAR